MWLLDGVQEYLIVLTCWASLELQIVLAAVQESGCSFNVMRWKSSGFVTWLHFWHTLAQYFVDRGLCGSEEDSVCCSLC